MYSKEKGNHILNRQNITRALTSVIVSMVIFYPFNIRFIGYIGFMLAVWCVLLVNYPVKKNSQFLFSTIIISITNLAVLILVKYFVHHTLHKDWFNIILCVGYVSVLLVGFAICLYYMKKSIIPQIDDKILFERRRYDLDRIQKYIEDADIVGVNGIWGSGKSFLVNQLKKHLKDSGKYIFIDVDLLSCNLDELQTILLNEMERVLYEHKIVPTHSTKLKRMLHDNVIYRSLYMLLMQDDMSYSEALNGFIQEINLLDVTIIIIYEDIDRISKVDTIKKIFSISEKLTGKNIKIIYQYEETKLNKLGLDREYLEKYIPYVINLTPIKFIEIIERVLMDDKIDEKVLIVEDFIHLTLPIYLTNYLQSALGINLISSVQMDNVATRKVKNFIKELVIILNEKETFNDKDYKHLVINFYFIKHFFSKLYDQFNLEKGLLDTIIFEFEDSKYTILELIAMGNVYIENSLKDGLCPDKLKELFNIVGNKEKLFLLSIFEYDLEIKDIKKDFSEIVNESVQNIKKKASNEKKDRLIWNLLCNGKSEYTDYEIAANKLIVDVLSKPKADQKAAYKIFQDEMFQGKHKKKDNKTVFKLGIPSFITLSQALRASNISENSWAQFISFYFDYTNKDIIDIELIQILNYCSLASKELYLDILNRFNGLRIVGNLNTEKSYKRFIKNYLSALSSLWYANTQELWRLDVPEGEVLGVREIEDAMRYIKKDISEMQNRISIEIIQDELAVIILFMDKNIEIVKSKHTLKPNEPRLKTEITSNHIHKEEFSRLAELQQTVNKDEFMKELELSYKNRFISVYEVNELLKQEPHKK